MAQQSPLLADYNQTGVVSPALQRALDAVRQKLPQFQGLPGAPSADSATPRLQPPGAPAPAISRTQAPGAAPGLIPPNGQTPAPPTAAPGGPATPRITDPEGAKHLTELHRLTDTGSGISQVHNPVARGLLRAADVVGSAFVPGITAGIPGTELHHNYLVRRAEGTVDKDVARAKENAGTANLEAETQKNLRPPIATNDLELWAQQNPGKSVEDFLKTKKENAPEHNETPFETWRKQNPTAPAEEWLKTEEGAKNKLSENTHVLPDGTVIAVHNDPKTGKSNAEVVYQGKPTEKPGHVIQRTVNGKLHNILVDAETGQDRQDLGEGRQPNANANDHGVTMIGKDGKVYRLEPGQSVPEGATTPTQAGSQNTLTTQQRNTASQATLVHEQTPYMLSELDRLKGKLGPMAGRWNEVMQGKLGMNDPDFAGLRADLLMYSSAVALMHARGRLPENLREEFDKAINNPSQDFANLKAVMTKVDGWTVKNPGVKDNGGGSNNPLPGGISLDDINAEIERRKNGPKK